MEVMFFTLLHFAYRFDGLVVVHLIFLVISVNVGFIGVGMRHNYAAHSRCIPLVSFISSIIGKVIALRKTENSQFDKCINGLYDEISCLPRSPVGIICCVPVRSFSLLNLLPITLCCGARSILILMCKLRYYFCFSLIQRA